ncbi:SDR family NAD(P)-dependent oxidoreductase [Massilia sp. Dwa41.01b]|uniref:SDR family oxidoreductase n=1 Tax=unclassified Massilia TaxID=2609279 RepID=UPI001601DB4B|nr:MULTISPECIES: SDR family oxidoreductase [unclassified Massilia]QNA90629.1 SDR family NAD(P)-dependent oxidoreductase [Massilia sp. Dwa41.01b]QNA97859.1 SDR family NAD(P)-dependent oxidoreductase [Massilia sp. Se16.2.3]
MASSLKPLDQQVMVITGASSGIGLATAHDAARRGAKLVLVARSGDVLAAVVESLASSGVEAIHVVADVSERSQVDHVAQQAVARFGRIDTWVNCAGCTIYGRLDEVLEADSRRLFDINFWGMVNGSLAALPHLRMTGGALINVGSEASELAIPLQGMYSASKHAVKGFTDALRIEIAHMDGAPVSITLIEPTAVDTPLPQHARNYLAHEPKLPAPQIDPHQVAGAILQAATTPTRSLKVGVMASLDVAMEKLMPGVVDVLSVLQVPRQQTDAPARDREGSLYKPKAEGRIYGCGNGKGR